MGDVFEIVSQYHHGGLPERLLFYRLPRALSLTPETTFAAQVSVGHRSTAPRRLLHRLLFSTSCRMLPLHSSPVGSSATEPPTVASCPSVSLRAGTQDPTRCRMVSPWKGW